VLRTTTRVGVVDQSMPPTASKRSSSDAKRLNVRLLEPLLQARIPIEPSRETLIV
jgi:hypothetical protein